MLDLQEKAETPVRHLSRGQKQKVSLAISRTRKRDCAPRRTHAGARSGKRSDAPPGTVQVSRRGGDDVRCDEPRHAGHRGHL
jgi:hypothetical protein